MKINHKDMNLIDNIAIPKLVSDNAYQGQLSLFLYEVNHSNVSGLSPTRVIQARKTKEMIKIGRAGKKGRGDTSED